MKKKLAIVMAVVMTLAPMNLFAASNNRPSKVATIVPGKTLFMESTWSGSTGIVDLDAMEADTDDIEYVVSGTDLIITLKDNVKVNDKINLTLENAEWYFKDDESVLTKIDLDGNFTTTAALKSTYDNTKGSWVRSTNTYTRAAMGTVGTKDVNELAYTLRVSNSADEEALVTITENGFVDDTIVIPLVSLSTKVGDVRVRIGGSNLTTISEANIQYGAASSTSTKTFVKEPVDARTSFELKQLVIQENGISSIKKMTDDDDLVTITAPSGFTFADPHTSYGKDDDGTKKYVTVNVEGGLTIAPGTSDALSETQLSHERVNYVKDTDNDTISVDLRGITPSTTISGKIAIQGLYLIADEDAPWGDINLKIKGGEGITEQTFKAGKRVDWTVEFKTITAVPTLVNGRYVSSTVGSTDSSKADDSRHLAATVSFTELSVTSWWSEKITTFDLSKGAKIRKIKISDVKNLDKDVNNNTIDFELSPVYTEGTNASYPNKITKNSLTVEGNRVNISGVRIKKDEKASFNMKLWLSIESGVEGDVTLTAAGSAIHDNLAPVVIAKAVSPVTIDTKVTDVKIGYQWQKVADFTITETGAGMLERNKTVEITLDDEIRSDYISFTPESVAEVIGNWKLKDFQSDSGMITFVIDRVSTEKAGAVKFTNVNVKIDRNAPETNKQAYKLIVGGNAVAENWQPTVTSIPLKFDRFRTKGIKADYLKVVTSGTNSTGIFTTVVKVTIGDKIIAVGQGTMEMDTAAFIDTASASTMVPVRFISQALGIPKDQIKWSDTDRTVTILSANRTIQFTIGSSDLYINGIKTEMVSEEGYPVKALIVEEIEGRSFIPFRALGDALGVTVAWDPDTKTATYNSDLMVK